LDLHQWPLLYQSNALT